MVQLTRLDEVHFNWIVDSKEPPLQPLCGTKMVEFLVNWSISFALVFL